MYYSLLLSFDVVYDLESSRYLTQYIDIPSLLEMAQEMNSRFLSRSYIGIYMLTKNVLGDVCVSAET